MCFRNHAARGSHLVKSRVDSTDFRQPAIWHVTHGVCGCQNCHGLQEEEPAVSGASAEPVSSHCLPSATWQSKPSGVWSPPTGHSTLGYSGANLWVALEQEAGAGTPPAYREWAEWTQGVHLRPGGCVLFYMNPMRNGSRSLLEKPRFQPRSTKFSVS